MPPLVPTILPPQYMAYAWGKIGNNSLVARLLGRSDPVPYAELWLSFAAPRNPLLKVLSVGDALSIQVHPEENQAANLGARDPEHYPNAAAKPEASVAITQVELLYGFRSAGEIRSAVNTYPELAALLTEVERQAITSGQLDGNALIAAVFSAVMRASEQQLKLSCQQLVDRLNRKSPEVSSEESWIVSLHKQYPADPGLLCFLLLNYVVLQPGESLFIGPGIVHAYLSGDMIECMAHSDTVVRAGLTPKFRDVETLLEIARLECQPVELTTPVFDEMWHNYIYPVKAFTISILEPQTPFISSVSSNAEDEIWLCLEGTSGSLTAYGQVFPLIPGRAYVLPSGLGLYEVKLESGKIARARKG